jgi:hypothetical protein
MIQRLSIFALLFIAACSSTPTANLTTFPYEIDRETLAQNPVKRVIITHINLGGPTRSYLQEKEPIIDKMVANYLEAHDIEVLPGRLFEQRWKTAVRIYGNPVDPTSGRMNQKTFALILVNVRDELLKTEQFDGFVFTDLLEQETSFSGGLKHMARWHGVSRKPTLQGPGEGVAAGFDWNKPVKAASLWVSIYDVNLHRVFTSIGGLDTTEAIDTRSSSGRYVRRRSILENKSHIFEGIELAFHPFIEMRDYPGGS